MMCIKERNRIRQDVVKLDESENLEDEIEKLEKKFFQKQIEIFDIDLKILEEEEQFIRLNLREYMTVDQQEEEDMFFEAFEEQPEDSEMIFDISPGKEDNNIDPEELKRKQEWVRKLNRIFRKRAWIRNKKVCYEFDCMCWSMHLSSFKFEMILFVVYTWKRRKNP